MQLVVVNEYGEFGERFVDDLVWVLKPHIGVTFISDLRDEGAKAVSNRIEYAKAVGVRVYILYNATRSQVEDYVALYGALFAFIHGPGVYYAFDKVLSEDRYEITTVQGNAPIPFARALLKMGV